MNESEIFSDSRVDVVEDGNTTTATKKTIPNAYSNGYQPEYVSGVTESEQEPVEVFEDGANFVASHFLMTPVP